MVLKLNRITEINRVEIYAIEFSDTLASVVKKTTLQINHYI